MSANISHAVHVCGTALLCGMPAAGGVKEEQIDLNWNRNKANLNIIDKTKTKHTKQIDKTTKITTKKQAKTLTAGIWIQLQRETIWQNVSLQESP